MWLRKSRVFALVAASRFFPVWSTGHTKMANGSTVVIKRRNRAIALNTQTLTDGNLSQPFLSGASPAAFIDLHISKT